MLYVSFAQIPKATPVRHPPSWVVRFSVRVTTDLKDRSLSSTITLNVKVLDEHVGPGGRQGFVKIHTQQWTPRNVNDVCKIEFNTPRQIRSSQITLCVTASASTYGQSLTEPRDLMYDVPRVPLQSRALPPVVSVYSAGLDLTSRVTSAPPLQYRMFSSPSESAKRLKLWEDLGNSLARHMWDGGVALAAWLDMKSRADACSSLQEKARPRLRILEVGCGIGTVGIHLAQLLPNTSVTLTDLADAQQMVELNIKEAMLAEGSEVAFDVMDWEDELYPAAIARHPLDLIVISECFYNTAMAEALIRKLKGVMGLHVQNFAAPILISWKCRHPDEQLFKSMMEEQFELTFQDSVPMPEAEPEVHCELDPITDEPIATSVFVYRHPDRTKLQDHRLDSRAAKVGHLPLGFLWEDSLLRG